MKHKLILAGILALFPMLAAALWRGWWDQT